MITNENINYKIRENDLRNIRRICLVALILRLFMIFLIYAFQNKLGLHLYIDDLKYETYARVYSQVATSLYDKRAFMIADNYIGGVYVAQVYFRLNAIIFYITKSVVSLRLVNIIFSSLTVIPIYLISLELFDSEAARKASYYWALLPYHVIMSSFLFKDVLIVLLTSASLYLILRYYETGKINWIFFILLILPLEWLRNGMPMFLILVLFFAFILRLDNKYSFSKVSWIIASFVFFIIGLILYIVFFKDVSKVLIYKFNLYLNLDSDSDRLIRFIRIKNLREIYKLPITWIFSTFMPITFTFKIDGWKNIMWILNYTLLILSPAYILNVLFKHKSRKEVIFLLPMLFLHLATIITVISIPRHYYFLHFYIVIYASDYLSRLNKKETLLYTFTVLMGLSIILIFSIIK